MNNTWMVATSNQGKLHEIENFLGGDFKLVSMAKKNIQGCDEPFDTFIENALCKARHVSKISKMCVLADDSGLLVNGLNGAPGVKSARFFEGHTTLTRDEANNAELLKRMGSISNIRERSAYFVSVVVGISNCLDSCPAIGVGIWRGRILTHSVGENGHGYDPIFYCPIAKKTAAQMSLNEKEKYSHRGKALQNILPQLIYKNS